MPGTAGAAIGLAAGNVQSRIGPYVQDTLNPTADLPYIGVNTNASWTTNILDQDYATGFTTKVNDNAATGGLAAWVKNGATALVLNARVNLASGVATANASGTHICLVAAGVPANYWFWAPVYAGT